MSVESATAVSCPNIAFIKYWGNQDENLRIPSNGSISMNLDGLSSQTSVEFDNSLDQDELILNGVQAGDSARQRASEMMDRVRQLSGLKTRSKIESYNNFPTGTGIASSASGFSALALAASRAAGLELTETELSRLARRASGSACRSIPGGFVEWLPGKSDEDSYAVSIAPQNYWELRDCIAVISHSPKEISSELGHSLASSSPLQTARVIGAVMRLEDCRNAIIRRDFEALAFVMELDSNLMHTVMMTSTPPLMYWMPATIRVMTSVQAWRRKGMPVCYTIDAGPNVHVICQAEVACEVIARLDQIEGIERVLSAAPGGPARLVADHFALE